jgi:hypothetical protein
VSRYDLQSEFASAYVRAVAAAAGFFIQEATRTFDADGLDLEMMCRGPLGVTRSPRLHLQVKSFCGEVVEDPFAYDLDMKNYDELRDITWQIPRVLLVVVVPRQAREWLTHSEKELAMRRCGYWHSLRGEPQVPNMTKRRVHIQRANVFDVKNAQELMRCVAERGVP